jgi:chromosome segregation ATPase
LKRLLVLPLVVVLAGGAALPGCDDASKARVDVAKEAAVKKLDGFLGSLDVKRKEIDLAIKSLKTATTEISKQRIKAQVKADQIDSQAQPIREQIAKTDSSLKKFRELIAAGTPGEIAGNSYSLDEIKAMAAKVIDARKRYEAQVASFDQSQAGLKKIVTSLDLRRDDLQSKINQLETSLTKIDMQMASAKAMKDASTALGDSEASLDQNIANLEDMVADLMAETQSELAIEGEKWDFAAADQQIDSVDSIISKTQGPADTLAEIDLILGNATE